MQILYYNKITPLNFYLLLIILLISSCSDEPYSLPDKIFELELSNKLQGSEAADYVNNLHFVEVTDKMNVIGFYKGDKGNAVIYLTIYSSNEEAISDEKKMTDKISPENSVFILGRYIDFENKRIYRTFGMGQTHYVFTHNNILYWISAETLWAKDFLNEFLNYVQ